MISAGPTIKTQLERQFLETIDEVVAEPHRPITRNPPLSMIIGEDRAIAGVHPSQSLAAAHLIFVAALPGTTEFFAAQDVANPGAVAALRLNEVILRRMGEAAAAYVEYLLDARATAHRDEARRISRELHDVVAPAITVGLQGVDLAEVYLAEDLDRAAVKINETRKSLQRAVALVRDLSRTTRLVVEPRELARAFEEQIVGLNPSVTITVRDDTDPELLSAYRANEIFLILREATRNALGHGTPTAVDVAFETRGTSFVGTVIDDGSGFDATAESTVGTGITSMRERAGMMGADLNISSRPGRTAVTLTVPLPHLERR